MSDSFELVINGQPRRASSSLTVAALLQELKLNSQQVAVEVNLELVPRELHATRALSAGDRVEIVTLVGGG